ncbi:VgrG protein [Klebsiella pneumoniae IS43]|uniref:VgrG protein n=1 Tax=Klebsiella pneumoniae IS43 TaxID=1432552 RepID=W1DI72_KLEPN|nr:VgrG protein [Klebsiella pneumoniae IS43]
MKLFFLPVTASPLKKRPGIRGRADAEGKTASVYTALPESIKIELL